ncbi:glycosyltransferase family 2 protein [Mesorhizobium sp. AaZ16]|uniref:glycosyltransferase family 2 protein n=1 Tax=Mesorhizobium sp. AaZ16 TaxID=3402289 RepID=UPI00374E2BE1
MGILDPGFPARIFDLNGSGADADLPPPPGESGISVFAALLLPELADWQPVLDRAGVPFQSAVRVASSAGSHGTTFLGELLASGAVEEVAFYRAIAQELGVSFQPTVDAGRLLIRDADCLAALRRPIPKLLMARMEEKAGATTLLVAPDRASFSTLRRLCGRDAELRRRLRIVAPSALRRAMLERAAPLLARSAVTELFDRRPDCSARTVLTGSQGYVLGAISVALPWAFAEFPSGAFLAFHIFFSLLFLACVGLRVMALSWTPPPPRGHQECTSPDCPVYSVLVALHREANVVPDLLVALSRLRWPRSKLEIKLVCEADDLETIAAINAHPLRSYVEVVAVSPGEPRTKPKALAFALPLVSGEFVVLYDAEDRPHPLQLMEAWQKFRASGPELACLQAPLEVSNRTETIVSRMFAFEYTALFRRLLPWLAAKGVMFPLGGTSNHFRLSALAEVGGWDPYNVTEDADLGLRLARFGYRADMISCPTLEDGPEEFKIWRPQRTRWFKGWMQTWLVHMRNPRRLAGDLDPMSFWVGQILFAGMAVSALVHPILIVTLAWLTLHIAAGVPLSTWQSSLLWIDSGNIALGYASFMALGSTGLKRQEKEGLWKVCLFTPVYWAMMSVAAWCALFQLIRRPHHWDKTPHRSARPKIVVRSRPASGPAGTA